MGFTLRLGGILPLFLVLLLAACGQMAKRPAAVVDKSRGAPAGVSAEPALSQRAVQRVVELLERAETAMAQKRLTSPEEDNAWRYYLEVLAILPGNEEAERGLANIAERYLQWSDIAAQQGRGDRARDYLAKAAKVQPGHAGIAAAKARLAKQVDQNERYVPITRQALQRKDKALRQQLAALADRVKATEARLMIEAPSDSDGRWIYQQLNERHEEFRIRANFRLKQQPGIRLLY